MRKMIFAALAVMAVASASAQHYNKANIFGVRGGLNASMLTTNADDGLDAERQARLGWYLGVSDQILLARRLPFYFETGLFLSNKGGGYRYMQTAGDDPGIHTMRFDATYLQVPLRINYHVDGGTFTLEPYVGFHYNIGLWGREVHRFEPREGSAGKEVLDIYREGGFRRSDFGVALGIGGTWSDIYFGLGWETGFLNMMKAAAARAYNSSTFQVLVGYNF